MWLAASAERSDWSEACSGCADNCNKLHLTRRNCVFIQLPAMNVFNGELPSTASTSYIILNWSSQEFNTQEHLAKLVIYCSRLSEPTAAWTISLLQHYFFLFLFGRHSSLERKRMWTMNQQILTTSISTVIGSSPSLLRVFRSWKNKKQTQVIIYEKTLVLQSFLVSILHSMSSYQYCFYALLNIIKRNMR